MRQPREKKAFINISWAEIEFKKKKMYIYIYIYYYHIAGQCYQKEKPFSELFNQIERNCFKIVHRKYISEESERERKGERRVYGERQSKVFGLFIIIIIIFLFSIL